MWRGGFWRKIDQTSHLFWEASIFGCRKWKCDQTQAKPEHGGFIRLMDNLSALKVNGIPNLINEYSVSTLVIDRNLTLFISSKADVHDSKTCLSTLKSSFLEHFLPLTPWQESIWTTNPWKDRFFTFFCLQQTIRPENSNLGRF